MTPAAAGPSSSMRRCGAVVGASPAAAFLLSALTSLLALGGCVSGGASRVAPAAPVPIVSEQLIGLTPAALIATLGNPRTLRRERPAEVWQYRGDSCVLDIFLYEAAEGPQVIHLEARDSGAEPMAPQHCLGAMPGVTGI